MSSVIAIENTEIEICVPGEKIPNAITLAAMQEAEAMIGGGKPCAWYQSPEDFCNALKKEILR